MDHRIYLALGTNLGDRLANLRASIAALPPAVEVLDQSPIYETEPWGYTDQSPFLNRVLKAQTHLAPLALLEYLKQIETSLGRAPTFRYGPRLNSASPMPAFTSAPSCSFHWQTWRPNFAIPSWVKASVIS
jgi:7,8-dihydro-6-hydroxymethylpterin-pyrophosphokinase